MKAVRDAPVGRVEHRGLLLHRPLTDKGPMIEREARGGSIDARLVNYCPTGRRKVLGALIADIVFWRPQVAPIGGSFNTTASTETRSGAMPPMPASASNC